MTDTSPPRRRHTRLSPAQKDAILADYELGVASGRELARRYGVHYNTLSNLVRARGAVKGGRAFENVVDLVAELDAKAEREAHAKVLDDIRRLDEFLRRTEALGEFMAAFIDADRHGALVEFGKALPRVRQRDVVLEE